MYKDLKEHLWWPGMKEDVAKYVAKCLTCQKIKAEHQRPGGELQPIEVPEWKWEQITMDFVVGLPKTAKSHDAIWVIVDRLTKSAHFIPIKMTYSLEQLAELYVREVVRLHGECTTSNGDKVKFQHCISSPNRWSPVHWYETGESLVTAPDFVENTTEAVKKIQERIQTAQSRQKSYADKRRRPLEFKLHEDLTYEEKPAQILDRKTKTLRNKEIPLVKVLWRNQKMEEATWEREDEMRIAHPELF
ncbi:hypothetical protein UlMin_039958 [Ulmus minor]